MSKIRYRRRWGVRGARACRVLMSACCLAIAAGCTAAPPPGPFGGNDPADPARPLPAIAPENYLGAYVGRRPVEPLSWREQNERVAPGRRP